MIGWLLPYPSAPAAFWLRIAGETAKDGYSAARMIGVFRKSFWDLTGTAPVRSRFSDSICFVLRGCPAAERRRCILTEGSGDTGMHSCSSASRRAVHTRRFRQPKGARANGMHPAFLRLRRCECDAFQKISADCGIGILQRDNPGAAVLMLPVGFI